jgi:hypothetical protein
MMKMAVLGDAETVARKAATVIAAEARDAVFARGRFIVAFSGGHTPGLMLRALTLQAVPWEGVHVVQVDERVAPARHPDRNLTHLRESLLAHAPLRPEQIHAMPVEEEDLIAAARRRRVDSGRPGAPGSGTDMLADRAAANRLGASWGIWNIQTYRFRPIPLSISPLKGENNRASSSSMGG